MIYEFGGFELDMGRAELRLDGRVCPLEPQVFAVLAVLVESRDRLVCRDELIARVWGGRNVADATVAGRIKSLRHALGDDGRTQGFIRTIHGRGFRFVAEVRLAKVQQIGMHAEPASAPNAELLAQPSIAVLPFRRVGEAGTHPAIGDALPHELIIELSRLRWIFVSARGSSFRFRTPGADVGDIGRALGVRYCLSGTIEAVAGQLAVYVELADTRDARVIWAERYRGLLEDIHQVRSEIVASILAMLEVQIPLHEAAAARLVPTRDLDAWSAYHLGLQHLYRFTRSDNEAAATLFKQAIARDDGFARAHAGLSFVHFQTAFMRYSDDVAGHTGLARRCAQRALDHDARDPFVNFAMGRTYWLEGDLDAALAWLERATVLSPNYAQGLYAQGWTESLAGQGLDGRRHVDLAMRASPLDPLHYAMLGTRALGHMVMGEDADAASWAERAARAPGSHELVAMICVAAQTLAGNVGPAAQWSANVRLRNHRLTRQDFFRAFPVRPVAQRARIADALVRAGF